MSSEWFRENWFNLTQSIGIVGSLVFTGLALRWDTLSQRRRQELELTEQHRELWSEVHRRPELSRVVMADVDLVAQPVTLAEAEFLGLVITHFQTGLNLANQGAVLARSTLEKDAANFFRLPIPNRVWRETRDRYGADFVAFIDRCLGQDRMPGSDE